MHLTSRESYPAQIDTRPSSTRIDFISVYYAFCCSIFLLFKIKLREPAIEEGKTKRRKTLSPAMSDQEENQHNNRQGTLHAA